MSATSVRSVLGTMKKSVLNAVPRGLRSDRGVAQLFIHENGLVTDYTLINFPSFFAPAKSGAYRYVVRLYDAKGVLVGSRDVDLPPQGSVVFRPADHFGQALPSVGMVTVALKPSRTFSRRDNHLGTLTAHFYALYRAADWSSFGLVHPQSVVGSRAVPDFSWASSQWISPGNVSAVDVYQINPGPDSCESEVWIEDNKGTVFTRSKALLPSFGARKMSFPVPATPNPFLRVGVMGFPGQNSKPLVMVRFNDGSFSVAHG